MVALPKVETPDTDKLSKNLALVDVVILSVDATPVNPPPSPENVVAVITPVTFTPVAFAVVIPAIVPIPEILRFWNCPDVLTRLATLYPTAAISSLT